MKNKINGLIYEMVFIEHSESYCGYLLVPSCWSELIETEVSQPHGGITYSQIQPTKTKEGISWTLLGFDCNHFGDAGRGATKKKGYRTSKYVKRELKNWSREIMEQLKKEILKDFTKKEIRLLKKLIDLKRECGVKFKNKTIWKREEDWIIYSKGNKVKTFPLVLCKTLKSRKRGKHLINVRLKHENLT